VSLASKADRVSIRPPAPLWPGAAPMRHPGWKIFGLALSLLMLRSAQTGAEGPRSPVAAAKKILVERFPSVAAEPGSQEASLPASLGSSPETVLTLRFRPNSDPITTRRLSYYQERFRRDDLTLSPSLVIDGRLPIAGAAREPSEAGVALEVALNGTGRRRALSVKLCRPSLSVVGRQLLVGVALTEDPVTTRVRSGGVTSRSVVEHHLVRRFEQETIRLEKTGSRSVTVPLAIAEDDHPERFRVVVFVQDLVDGEVYQADSIPWVPPPKRHEASARSRRNPGGGLADFGFTFPNLTSSGSDDDSWSVCPDCGTPFSMADLLSRSNGRKLLRPSELPSLPLPMC
jgi:hypothetical protein